VRNPKGDVVSPAVSGGKSGGKRSSGKTKSGITKSKKAATAGNRNPKRKKKSAEEEGTPKPAKDSREVVREAKPVIIENLVEWAKKGSCPHIKLLMELYPEVGNEVEPEARMALAELLLKELNGDSAGETTTKPLTTDLHG
jgi:hypothetical protein